VRVSRIVRFDCRNAADRDKGGDWQIDNAAGVLSGLRQRGRSQYQQWSGQSTSADTKHICRGRCLHCVRDVLLRAAFLIWINNPRNVFGENIPCRA